MMSVALFAGINFDGQISAGTQFTQSLDQLPSDFTVGTGTLLPAQLYSNMSAAIGRINGIEAAELRSVAYFVGNASGTRNRFVLIGVPRNSLVYSGVTVQTGVLSSANYNVYVWSSSINASRVHLDDSIHANFSTFLSATSSISITRNLKVAALIDINQVVLSKLTNIILTSNLIPANVFSGTVLLADWTAIFPDLISSSISQGAIVDPFGTQVFVYASHTNFMGFDFQSSITKAESLHEEIQTTASQFGANAFGESLLISIQSEATFIESIRLLFIAVAIPVFLIAWLLTSAVFSMLRNNRVRDVALHLVKGFSPSQLSKMSILEAIFIGLVGTAGGIAIAESLAVLSAPTSGFIGWNPAFEESIVLAILFGLLSTILLFAFPSWKIAQLSITESLKEEEAIPQPIFLGSNRKSWIAFLIGLYGSVATLISFNSYVSSQGTLLVTTLISAWNSLEIPLLVVAPFILLWGTIKLLVYSGAVDRLSAWMVQPFLSSLAELSARPLRRNVAWLFRFTFLIALAISYMVLSSGFVSSQDDYQTRRAESVVGADIMVSVPTLANETLVNSRALSIARIIGGWQGVSSTTVVFSTTLIFGRLMIPTRIVDPITWPSTAYYEEEWFSPSLVRNLFVNMRLDNHTVILSKDLVDSVSLTGISDPIGATLTFGIALSNQTLTENLRVLGLFGPVSSRPHFQAPEPSWSYVPAALFGDRSPSTSGAAVLVKVVDGSSATTIRNRISNELPGVYAISASETGTTLPIDLTTSSLTAVFTMGLISVGVGSYVGLVALVVGVSASEKRENSLLEVKGFSKAKVRALTLSRFLPMIIVFALLGVGAGYIALVGILRILNFTQLGFVTIRPVFGQLSLIVTASYLGLLSAGVALGVLIETGGSSWRRTWRSSNEL
jgi:ABC-type antimicrobial peptide transport system permease subunit